MKPRSSRSAVLAIAEGILVVSLAAPPVDGEANAELLRLLASFFRLPKTRLRVIHGERSRLKTVQFSNALAADLHVQASTLTFQAKP